MEPESSDEDYGVDYDFNDIDSEDSDEDGSYYTILSEADIRSCQEDIIKKIMSVFSISKDDAGILLLKYNWSVIKVRDAWFADAENVRRDLGLMNIVPLIDSETLYCGICFDDHPRDMMRAAACGHPFCVTCWQGHMSASIKDGPRCLKLRCPWNEDDLRCQAAVGQDMINLLAKDDDKDRYNRHFLRSFIEDSENRKWCPAPGCDYAVEFRVGSGRYDATCRCSYRFCCGCNLEPHSPIDCETASKWLAKNIEEAGSDNWLLVYSKPCPECKRPLEKTAGCTHITCKACLFEFCWTCLAHWKTHSFRSVGGGRFCNDSTVAEKERQREIAKDSLERYTQYYERWAENDRSMQKAIDDLKEMQAFHLEKISYLQCQPQSQLKFIIEAWQQIIECRRVLKWTYTYGYYLPEDDPKREQLENLQDIAMSHFQNLQECAVEELQRYLSEGPSKDFNEFRRKLGYRTRTTKNHFKELLRALENTSSS